MAKFKQQRSSGKRSAISSQIRGRISGSKSSMKLGREGGGMQQAGEGEAPVGGKVG